MKKSELRSVSIIGLGLLGGSVGLAVNRVRPGIKRIGYSHREVTRQKALDTGVVDVVYPTPQEAVRQSQLVILASPIGTFQEIMNAMAGELLTGALVTDVGSTKTLPVRWANRSLPESVTFLGSHPMAGSEQRGVEFARADLFDGAWCILTPESRTPDSAIKRLTGFWEMIGMRTVAMSPSQHDRTLARISHLPHVMAAALINASRTEEMALCGKGFLDTTRIASGPESIWHDILTTNPANTDRAIERLIKELRRVQDGLKRQDGDAIRSMLARARKRRNELVNQKLSRKELPA